MKYIASWSGGKDFTASIILAHEHNEPLDMIIFAEVMFDENISGELPEHIEFVHRAAQIFESWGYPVHILRSDKTYMDCFFNTVKRSKIKERNGKINGFPMSGKCIINDRCKMKPIRKFWKSIKGEYTQYVGIAKDEIIRLGRIVKTKNTVSLLEKYGYTENMALELCKKYDLLSPIYKYTNRGGCWFCPNLREVQLRHLRKNYRYLWEILIELEKEPNKIGEVWNTLTRTRIWDLEIKFSLEEKRYDESGRFLLNGHRNVGGITVGRTKKK